MSRGREIANRGRARQKPSTDGDGGRKGGRKRETEPNVSKGTRKSEEGRQPPVRRRAKEGRRRGEGGRAGWQDNQREEAERGGTREQREGEQCHPVKAKERGGTTEGRINERRKGGAKGKSYRREGRKCARATGRGIMGARKAGSRHGIEEKRSPGEAAAREHGATAVRRGETAEGESEGVSTQYGNTM